MTVDTLAKDYAPTDYIVKPKDLPALSRLLHKPRQEKKIKYGVFIIRNRITKKYYERTLPRTDLHFYTDSLQHAATFQSNLFAEERAREIRGTRWQKDFEIVPVKVTRGDNNFGKKSYVEEEAA